VLVALQFCDQPVGQALAVVRVAGGAQGDFSDAAFLAYYLNRWIQPDPIIPDGPRTAVSVLTVSFSNYGLLTELNRENRDDGPRGLAVVQWYQDATGRPAPELDDGKAVLTEAELNHSRPGNPESLNRYAYVLDNSLKYTDPSGYWTVGVGLGFTGGVLGGGLSGSVMLVFDDEGRAAIVRSGGGGGYAGLGGSLTLILQATDADKVQDLNGPVVQTGGSLQLAALNAWAEWVVQQTPAGSQRPSINGANLNIGAGADPKQVICPFEVHTMLETSRVHVIPAATMFDEDVDPGLFWRY
jgi:hypothetical protein